MATHETFDGLQRLNPSAPQLYLSPEEAQSEAIVTHIILGCFAVISWDIANSCAKDVRLLVRQRFNLLAGAFVVSRLSAFGLLLSAALMILIEIDNCQLPVRAGCVFFVLNRISTSILFFARAYAVYRRNRWAVASFTLLWMFVVGAACLILFESEGVHIGPTRFCTTSVTKQHLVAITPAAEAVFDIFVCISITHELIKSPLVNGNRRQRTWWRRWILPDHPRSFSSRFLQDSQLYLTITSCIKIPELILIIVVGITFSRPSAIQFILIFPDTVVSNAMASRIYRKTKKGRPGIFSASTGSTSLELAGLSSSTNATSRKHTNP